MFEILEFAFMQRAFIAGITLGALLAFLGVFVVLKKMSFFADGIAHASLSGIAIGILLSWNPLIVALIVSAILAVLMYVLEKKYRLSSDTAIGIMFTSGMALGVLLLSLKSGYQPELVSFLFGNILAIITSELWIMIVIAFAVSMFVGFFMREFILLSLDKELAHVSGVKVNMLELTMNVILAIVVVLGIKIFGVILVSALLVIPVAIAKVYARSFQSLLLFSVIAAEIMVIIGIILSYYFDLPTGPSVVLLGTIIYIISLIAPKVIGKKS